MAYLRDFRGTPVSMWVMLNRLCQHPVREQLRRETRFYLLQLNRLVREGKVIRYGKIMLRGKIRINEAYA